MNTYYIVLETRNKLGWKIRDTINDLDLVHGLIHEIHKLEEEYDEPVMIISWKKLNNKLEKDY